MIIETGTLTGKREITLVIFSLKVEILLIITTWTAVIAIINTIMFQIPDTTYYLTTSSLLGKMYSNTMMMNINSRIVSRYFIADNTVSNELSIDTQLELGRSVSSTAHVVRYSGEAWPEAPGQVGEAL